MVALVFGFRHIDLESFVKLRKYEVGHKDLDG